MKKRIVVATFEAADIQKQLNTVNHKRARELLESRLSSTYLESFIDFYQNNRLGIMMYTCIKTYTFRLFLGSRNFFLRHSYILRTLTCNHKDSRMVTETGVISCLAYRCNSYVIIISYFVMIFVDIVCQIIMYSYSVWIVLF